MYDWIGQAYTNSSSDPLTVTNGTNQESTSGTTVSSQGYSSCSDIDGASTYRSSGGIPIAEYR